LPEGGRRKGLDLRQRLGDIKTEAVDRERVIEMEVTVVFGGEEAHLSLHVSSQWFQVFFFLATNILCVEHCKVIPGFVGTVSTLSV
jgi:hypothetical protein